MMFRFKKPNEKTLEIMGKQASGQLKDTDFNTKAQDSIKELTKHEYCTITTSGNNSIFIALSSVEGSVIIPDQGGWHGFKQIAKFLNKKIITLKTDFGIIEPKKLDEIDIPKKSALIYTSFAGYCGEQDTKSISKYCRNNDITVIEDASAGIGDEKSLLGNSKYADIILASTGSPKLINVGTGGFLTTDNKEVLEKTSMPQKLSKTNEIICSGIYEEIKYVRKNLQSTLNATKYLKKHIPNTIHTEKRGVNIIIRCDDSKQKTWVLKKELPINKSGFITNCPNYNRVKTKAISVEIKNLHYTNLKKEYLDEIINKINNLQQDGKYDQ